MERLRICVNNVDFINDSSAALEKRIKTPCFVYLSRNAVPGLH